MSGVGARFFVACALGLISAVSRPARAAPEPTLAETIRGMREALRGYPRGAFAFEANNRFFAPPEGWLRGLEQYVRTGAERMYRKASGSRNIPEKILAGIRKKAVERADWERDRGHSPDEGIPIRFRFDFYSDDLVEVRIRMRVIGPEGRPVGTVLKTTQFNPRELLDRRYGKWKQGGREVVEQRVTRSPRTRDDLVLGDSTLSLHPSRQLVMETIDSMLAEPEGWRLRREGEKIIASYYVTWPDFSHPPISKSCSELSAVHEWVLTAAGPQRYRVYDGHGKIAEEVLLEEVVSDKHGSLPLRIKCRSWFPGPARALATEYVARGKRVEPREPAALAEIIDRGTRVTDNRFNPPVVYVVDRAPLQDSEVAQLSARAADERPLLRTHRKGGDGGPVVQALDSGAESPQPAPANASGVLDRVLVATAVAMGLAALLFFLRFLRRS